MKIKFFTFLIMIAMVTCLQAQDKSLYKKEIFVHHFQLVISQLRLDALADATTSQFCNIHNFENRFRQLLQTNRNMSDWLCKKMG